MKRILDQLDAIERAVVGLAGRLDRIFSTIDFSTMTTPALVVAGDKDDSAWQQARNALTGIARPLGRVESK